MNKERFYDKALDWIIQHGPNIVIAIIVMLAGMWVIRLIKKYVINRFATSTIDISLRPFIQSILTTALYVLLVLIVVQVLGLQMTIFAAIIGGLGVAAGLSLSGTLQNFASGILILLLKPFKVGENIVAQGNEGTVTAIRIFYTIITTYDNKTVVIPNSKLSNEVITNLSREGKRRLDIELKFNYGIEFNMIKESILKTLNESNAELENPQTRIGISSLEPDGYKVIVNTWLTAHEFYDKKFSLQETMMNNLKTSGVKLPGMA